MAANVPVYFTTHAKRVCKLYKNALRSLESWHDRRDAFRYRAVLLRKRFEDNKKINDECLAVQILEDGEKELFDTQHYQPKKFQYSPGGCAYDRETLPPDWVLDYWHPLEKALYPEYFAKREERKQQFIAMWDKQYGPYKPEEHH